jgi:hypothetical protein
VAEDAKTAGKKGLLDAISFYILVFQKLNHSLCHGQTNRGHAQLLMILV